MPVKLKMRKTASDTYRVLVNGCVHPLLVGFHSRSEARHKAMVLFPDGQFIREDATFVYVPPVDVMGDAAESYANYRRYLPSETEMTEMLDLVENNTPEVVLNHLMVAEAVTPGGEPLHGRYYLIYKGTRFEMNHYDLEALPAKLADFMIQHLVIEVADN